MIHETTFRNLSEQNLDIQEVMDRIAGFIAQDPRAIYNLVITTDAQVHSGHTKFVTFIVAYRVGQGAWLCSRQVIVPREINAVQEKLLLETTYSQEIAVHFDYAYRVLLEDMILPYMDGGADIKFFIDIDGGTDKIKNKTAAYVAEMVSLVEAMGLIAHVKPESVMVSLADRETKKPYRYPLSAAANS
ncbi:ribonuclease H-like YkuK family protein [Paenibacillus oenotherae]|uniref:Ribonuclease H-like YkuK family protein n=2 Tax=Paenibacillus oenotherae TaxID=1435645 RepID=A0ABS7D7B7_9BACL|nr:ribonuclease H-like YkuK family protein [Paenibacillus oenotherae]